MRSTEAESSGGAGSASAELGLFAPTRWCRGFGRIALLALGSALIGWAAPTPGNIPNPVLMLCGVLVAFSLALLVRRWPIETQGRRFFSFWFAFVAAVQVLFLIPSIVRHTPRLWNPLQQVLRDHELANRGRNTVCRQLDIDPTRLPVAARELTAAQQTKLAAYVDQLRAHVAARGALGDPPTASIIRTDPVLVERFPAAGPLPAGLQLYRIDPADLDGVYLLETMLVGEHSCPSPVPAEAVPCRGGS